MDAAAGAPDWSRGRAGFAAGAGADVVRRCGRTASLRSRNAVMSCLVMRPPSPVPATCAQVDVVFARDLADQRRRAGVILFFLLLCNWRRWLGFDCREQAVSPKMNPSLCGGAGRARAGGAAGADLGRRTLAIGGNRTHHSVYLNGCTLGNFNVLQDARGRRGNFRVHLVGGNFKQAARRAAPCHQASSAIW